jgi:hypothetical protein
VHVPHEYLEQYAIKGRARLELVDGGILIRAVEPPHSQTAPAKKAEESETSGAKEESNAEEKSNAKAQRSKGAKKRFLWFS